MKNKKGNVSAIMGMIVFLIVIFIVANYTLSSGEKMKGTVSESIDNIYSIEAQVMSDNSQLAEPVPELLVKYATSLVGEMFELPKIVDKVNGEIHLISPFENYLENQDEYEKYIIMMRYSNFNSPAGIFVYIHNTETKQDLNIESYKDTSYLQNKELCLLPGKENSKEPVNALVLGAKMKYSDTVDRKDIVNFDPTQLIENGKTKQIALLFGKEDAPWPNSNFPAFKAQSDSKPILIYAGYDKTGTVNPSKIPIYLHDDTVCFIPIGNAGNGIDLTNSGNKLNGYEGPLKKNILDNIQTIVQGGKK